MVHLKYFNPILDRIEKINPDAVKHAERVAMLSYALGRKYELTSDDREALYLAGLLHEIGKDLIADEYKDTHKKLQQIYPLLSRAMITAIDGYDRVAKIVAQHQENLDGTGYPLGIKAEDIHLFALIIHICDYYDHCRMNGDTHSMATAKLRQKSDTMFPKRLITQFIKMLIGDEEVGFVYEMDSSSTK